MTFHQKKMILHDTVCLRIAAVRNYISKLAIETLEQVVKYVQS